MATDPAQANTEQQALVAQFVQNQTNEIKHRAQELQLEKQRDDHAFEFGKESLAAQERDRIHERECARQQRKDGHRFILFVVLVVAVLVLAVIALGQSAIAMELVKAIVLLSAGAAGGYGYARSKKTDADADS